MNALKEWIGNNQETIQEEKVKAETQGKKCKKFVEEETTINLNEVLEISDSDFEFLQPDGSKHIVKRFFYKFAEYDEEKPETHPLLVPKSVHYSIVENIEEFGDKLKGVKIKKKGTGKGTEYKVFPII